MKKLLNFNARMVSGKPKLVLIIALVVTIVAGLFATNLSMELSWVSMAPDDSAAVDEYQEIIDNFPSLDSIIVIVESDDYEMLQQATKDAEQSVGQLSEYVTSVVAGVDRDFMLENAMLYLDEDEAEMMGYVFADKNVTALYQFTYALMDETAKKIADEGLTDEEIAYNAAVISGITSLIKESDVALKNGANKENVKLAIEEVFAGNGLITSPDGKMAMMTIQPSFDMMDAEMLTPGVDAIEQALNEVNDKYDNVTIRGTGMHVVARDEIVSVTNDSYLATMLSVLLILAVLYFSFRIWIAPIFTFAPLLFGIVWSMGLAGLTIGRLNMITVFSVAMLLGLGIDYSIHLYSSYTERRAEGIAKTDAISHAITNTGPSIIAGALTTAAAFFALNISSLKLLSELGTVMGLGIVTTLVAVFWVLPALIIIKKEKEANMQKIKGEFTFIGTIAKGVYKVKYLVLVIIVLGGVFMGYKATKIEFDMNLLHLEPKGLKSIELMEHMVDRYDMSSTSFALQVDSLEEAYDKTERLEKIDGVKEVASIASILPKASEQQKAIDAIDDVKEVLENKADQYPLDKQVFAQTVLMLEDVIETYEKAWKDNELAILSQKDFDNMRDSIDDLNELLKEDIDENNAQSLATVVYDVMGDIEEKMLSAELITPQDLPEAYKSQFVSKDGDKFLLTIYSEFDIWEELGKEKGNKLFDDMKAIDPDITGTPVFMYDLYTAVGSELLTTGLVLMGVLLVILLLLFRSIKYTLLSFLPLVFIMTYTLGTMSLFGVDFNMINFLVVLLIIGIGLDDGVHILHHYKEGERDIKVLFSKIGRAIFLTTVTTVFGFGSLSFSSYRGIAGLGIVLAIGVSLALVFTILVLPIFLKDVPCDKNGEGVHLASNNR